MTDGRFHVPAFLLGLLIASMFWGTLAAALHGDNKLMIANAIKHGAAHYDATTGAFTWNTP